MTVAFGLKHNLDAFIFYRGPGGAVEEFENIRYWVNIMKTVDYVAQTAIGDAVLVSPRVAYVCRRAYSPTRRGVAVHCARTGPASDSDNADASGLELSLLDGVQQKLLGCPRADHDVVRHYRCVCTFVSSAKAHPFPLSACGCCMIWVEATTKHDALLNESRIKPLLDSIVVLTLVMNVAVTCEWFNTPLAVP